MHRGTVTLGNTKNETDNAAMITPIYSPVKSPQEVAKVLAQTINEQLAADKKVLWFVAGGSCIPVAVLAAKQISPKNASNLAVTLTDERYGPVGHPDSNWQQLQKAGFSIPGTMMIPVLLGKDRTATTSRFAEVLKIGLETADFVYGLFGIGPDGHTAGILRGSEAVNSNELVCDYDGPDYQRITITPVAIAKFDEAVVYAVGEAKWPPLKVLSKSKDISVQPAQLLKRVPKLTIFTDYKQGES